MTKSRQRRVVVRVMDLGVPPQIVMFVARFPHALRLNLLGLQYGLISPAHRAVCKEDNPIATMCWTGRGARKVRRYSKIV
jgi:hypothetical protein